MPPQAEPEFSTVSPISRGPFALWQRIVVPAAALLVAGLVFAFGLWETRYMTWAPPTSITSAVDFSDDLSSSFEPSWRQFRFRRADYTQAIYTMHAWSDESQLTCRCPRSGWLTRHLHCTQTAYVQEGLKPTTNGVSKSEVDHRVRKLQ